MSSKVVLVVVILMVVAAGILSYINRQNVKPVVINEKQASSEQYEGTQNNVDIPDEGNKVTDDQQEKVVGCVVTGCSNQICASSERMTTCEYKEEYGCYADAVCELQADGDCGWTLSEKANTCLENAIIFGSNAI
jgi:hypothetical protein